jgi:hypothetical protein
MFRGVPVDKIPPVHPGLAAMTERGVEVFFYGLFMDADLLRDKGVVPRDPRRARVDGFALRIGRRATLVPAAGTHSHGMLMQLTHTDLDKLYSATELEQYRPEAVTCVTIDGASTAALCFNLPAAPAPDERNAAYAVRLQAVLRKLEFPSEYIASIS